MRRYYTGRNVFDAAEARMDFIWDHFKNPCISFSGGKDSTVILNLAIRAAERAGRLPVNVLFLDQEAEWDGVIDYMRTVRDDPRVNLHWYQGPFHISSGVSDTVDMIYCWQPGMKDIWMREKEPGSIGDNRFGTTVFSKLFTKIAQHYKWDATVSGMRAGESQNRHRVLVNRKKCAYKWISWSSGTDPVLFSPIYDWSTSDVWHAIDKFKWPYCRVYDQLYQIGVPTNRMRISSLSHEEAIGIIHYLQELEPDTWNRLQKRLPGFNAARQTRNFNDLSWDLPWMFKDWPEYLNYLVDKLVKRENHKETFRRQIDTVTRLFREEFIDTPENSFSHGGYITVRNAIMVGDYWGTYISKWRLSILSYPRGEGPTRRKEWRDAKAERNRLKELR